MIKEIKDKNKYEILLIGDFNADEKNKQQIC